ncbi:MAG: hypothetical protein AB7O74_17530, partial [Candidatus Nanopelagicales bacterium]
MSMTQAPEHELFDLGPVTDEERAFVEELWARDRALAEADDADFGAVWAEAFEWGSDGQRAESMLSRP